MNTPALEWVPREGTVTPAMFVPLAAREGRRHPVMIAGVFAAIALGALCVGLLLPEKYSASTTILVEETNIIGPLMEGRAVQTSVASRAAITRQIAFSRKVMNEILKAGGWLASDPSPVARERLIEQITDRTQISNPRENLIQISYTDSDSKRAFEVTRRFADLVIQENLATKERESRDAYEFIDSQVTQYHDKLTSAESKLEQYRRSNPDARAGIEADVNLRIGELRRQVETSRMELMDLRSQESAVQAQLSGESEISLVQTRAGQVMTRLAELENERGRLLLSFTEQHPDVIRVQHQIGDLQEELRRENNQQESRRSAGVPGAMNGPASFNPLYGELRSKLAEARSRSAATASRVGSSQNLLNEELARSGRIAASENSLAELTRDYEVNRDMYQDLLKRRENARVSMNLDAKQRGLTFSIQEPATVPLRPTGLRLMHIAGAGLGVAAMAPLLLLVGWVRLDPRVRTPSQIEQLAGLPVLGSIPLRATGRRKARSRQRLLLAGAIVLSVPVVYALVLIIR